MDGAARDRDQIEHIANPVEHSEPLAQLPDLPGLLLRSVGAVDIRRIIRRNVRDGCDVRLQQFLFHLSSTSILTFDEWHRMGCAVNGYYLTAQSKRRQRITITIHNPTTAVVAAKSHHNETSGQQRLHALTRGSFESRPTPKSLQTRLRSSMVMVVCGAKNTRLATTHASATRKGMTPPTELSSPSVLSEEEFSAVAEKPATARQSRLNLK